MKESKYLSLTERWSIRRKKSQKTEAPDPNQDHVPGALVYTGQATDIPVMLSSIIYDEGSFEEKTLDKTTIPAKPEQGKVLWLNVTGLHDTDLIREIGRKFNIHDLALEDVLNIHQRPAFELHDDNFFMAMKMLRIHDGKLIAEQLSLVAGPGFIITFQEQAGDVFDSVRNRLRKKSGLIRTRKSDYLAFALLDVIVDHYMEVVEIYGDEINDQEIRLTEMPDKHMLNPLNQSKREINYVRKYARPLLDAVMDFSRSEHPIIEKRTRPFLKDMQGHISQVTESIEIYRDTINDNLNTYHLFMNNRLNDILKVLTLFSVIFIPLTFLAGIYGMNFDYMPELHYEYAYPVFLITLVVVAGGMIAYFKKKDWL